MNKIFLNFETNRSCVLKQSITETVIRNVEVEAVMTIEASRSIH